MASCRPDNPLIVQGDYTILVEVASPRYLEARDRLACFAELVKAPEHLHTYRVTPLSVWSACAAGTRATQIIDALVEFSNSILTAPNHLAGSARAEGRPACYGTTYQIMA